MTELTLVWKASFIFLWMHYFIQEGFWIHLGGSLLFIHSSRIISILFLISFYRWTFLEIHSNASLSDAVQAKAAGMTEGSLTAELMQKSYQNTLAGYCDAEPEFCETLGKFLGDNLKWISKQIASNPTDKYWYQVKNLSCTLFIGMISGSLFYIIWSYNFIIGLVIL